MSKEGLFAEYAARVPGSIPVAPALGERTLGDVIRKTNVGDIDSDAKGTGARFNAGKPPYELVPLALMARSIIAAAAQEPEQRKAADALFCLGQFQSDRDTKCLFDALRSLGLDGWADCARVFDYGRVKYKAWNWAKGMPWSVPLACAARHLLAMINGETLDPESGLPHRGHVFCNIAMLVTYQTTYTEGDDLPPAGAL